ncbi:uncharacterized protein [Halyomorpha halys]|uniref:uncharacterized protein isoform X1 n=1 Tax=Halyomorpha halys TaxID=286706 RepID=UPI0006D4F419|nr:uncharacterized protein LOC106686601 isoform X1 [Halyomorpha halys]
MSGCSWFWLIRNHWKKKEPVVEEGRLPKKYRRRQLCDYLSSLIYACANKDNTEETCDKAILGAIQFHRKSKQKNNNVCLMGKYHNVLYVAARIAFNFKLKNTSTVQQLLQEIFDCEQTFERLVSGAIFGPKICSAFSGWKSEFDNRSECLQALKYFLHHAMLARLQFTLHGTKVRMADVPLQTCMRASPATVAIHAQRPDVFLLLVQYGAKLHQLPYGLISPLEMLDEMINSHSGVTCHIFTCRNIAAVVRPSGVEGWPVASLKHLARVAIRESLNDNFQLPAGIYLLPLPKSLIRYISLEGE